MARWFLLFLVVAGSLAQTVSAQNQPTRFPLILAHGILAGDGLLAMRKLSRALQDEGHEVFLTEVSAANEVSLRAAQLGEQVDEVLNQSTAEKVNVIAHSMGGLDARYLISRLGYENKVASLTTLSTPHRGSPVADKIVAEVDNGKLTKLLRWVQFISCLFNEATTIGEADLLAAIADLTTHRAVAFNRDVLNSEKVFYQSYGARADAATKNGIHRVLRLSHRIIEAEEGDNDGMVSTRSAPWGEYRGTVSADHFSLAGFGPPNKAPFDAKKLIRHIAAELSRRGF